MSDYYNTLIRENSDAASLLADECRKLRSRLEASEGMEMKISGENMRLIAENAALRDLLRQALGTGMLNHITDAPLRKRIEKILDE